MPVTDDLERRLRAALHAHADLVQETADDDTPRTAAPAGARPRWAGAVLVAAAAAAVIGAVAWLGPPGSGAPDRPAAASIDATTAAPDAGTLSSDAGAAAASGPVGGESFELYTHCGVLGTDIDGVWFAADPPLVEEFGPPAGWGDPYQPGTLARLSPTEAVFRDDAGHEVRLRADEAARPPLCD